MSAGFRTCRVRALARPGTHVWAGATWGISTRRAAREGTTPPMPTSAAADSVGKIRRNRFRRLPAVSARGAGPASRARRLAQLSRAMVLRPGRREPATGPGRRKGPVSGSRGAGTGRWRGQSESGSPPHQTPLRPQGRQALGPWPEIGPDSPRTLRPATNVRGTSFRSDADNARDPLVAGHRGPFPCGRAYLCTYRAGAAAAAASPPSPPPPPARDFSYLKIASGRGPAPRSAATGPRRSIGVSAAKRSAAPSGREPRHTRSTRRRIRNTDFAGRPAGRPTQKLAGRPGIIGRA
jgi:hypothetical protein